MRSADRAGRDARRDSLRGTRRSARWRFRAPPDRRATRPPAAHATDARRPARRLAAVSSTPLLRCAIQARFASSSAGLCCRGTNLRSASAMTAALPPTTRSAASRAFRARAPGCCAARAPAGARRPAVPRRRRTRRGPDVAGRRCRATAGRCARRERRRLREWRRRAIPLAGSGSGWLPDPRRLTRSTRMVVGRLSLFRCELLQQFSGSRAADLEQMTVRPMPLD